MPRPFPDRGFTLIELLITMAVLAVLAVFAVPGFTGMIVSNRAQTQTAAFVGALNYARAEAVKRGQAVTITAADGGNWHAGWTIAVGGTALRRQDGFGGGASLVSDDASISFDGQGRASSVAVDAPAVFAYCFADGHDDLERSIRVNHVGYVRVDREVCE